MAHTVEKNEFGVGNASSEIFGVFAFDKFIVLALHYHDRYADLREIARGVVRLRAPHPADVFDKFFVDC